MLRSTVKLHGSEFVSLDEAQVSILDEILSNGRSISPRGRTTLELPGVAFTLTEPRHRCILNRARKWSLALAVGEFCWHMSGSNDAESISWYAGRWAEFADETGRIRGSCYGHKTFGTGQPSRWERLKVLLTHDPSSRRAILDYADGDLALDPEAIDVSCVSTAQFLIRDGKLEAFVSMRSNDVILGLPYDVFLFSMLQELLALEIGIDLGAYHHSATSMHLYEHQVPLARRILECDAPSWGMPPMSHASQVPEFLTAEAQLRRGKTPGPEVTLDRYWTDLLDVLAWFSARKRSREPVPATGLYYQPVLAPPQ